MMKMMKKIKITKNLLKKKLKKTKMNFNVISLFYKLAENKKKKKTQSKPVKKQEEDLDDILKELGSKKVFLNLFS